MIKGEILNVIFISSTCAKEDYEVLCKKRKKASLDSSQKFFDMFINGLAIQSNVQVDCISVPPISRSTYKGLFIKGKKNVVKNVNYFYTNIVNFPVLKTLYARIQVKKILKRLIKEHKGKEIKIISDPLLLEGLAPTVKMARKHGLTSVGFLTDMPNFASANDKKSIFKNWLYKGYNNQVEKYLEKLDKYIILTEAMSCVTKGKPWLLIDCIVDKNSLNDVVDKPFNDDLPHVTYAGKLHREFGLDLLCQTITLVKSKCVFDIYGDGNYFEELTSFAKDRNNVNVYGIKPLNEVLSAEKASKVLVNPRTSQGEFTKYSFPSKTAEFMLSGVPVVMFRLPGVSDEYNQYISFAEEETPMALAKKIDEVLSYSNEEWTSVAERAKNFIVEHKNNVVQAKKIVDFIIE